MSVVIVNNPYEFQPSKSDGIYFTVSADTTTEPKFRFVYEVYVENYKVFEGKATPNPYGLGVIDISRVLDSYLQNYPVSYYDELPIFTHQTGPFSRPYTNEVVDYYIKIGEEYADSFVDPITGFTGVGNQVGFPSVLSGTFKAFLGTMGVNRKANLASFDIGQFTLSGNPSPAFPYTETDLFLTNSPRIRDIDPNEYYTLSFTNYNLGGPYLSEPYYAEYNFYDINGTLIDTKKYANIIQNGGGPMTSCTQDYRSFTFTGSSNYNILNIGVGPKNIYNFPANTEYYTVQLFGGTTGATPTPTPTPSPTSGVSPTPTPTNTQTPTVTPTITPSPSPACICYTYSLESNVGYTLEIPYTSCDGLNLTIYLGPYEYQEFCACSVTSNPNVTLTQMGVCGPSITPTPTPSITPSSAPNCVSGTTLNITSIGWIKYTTCNGDTQYEYFGSTGLQTISSCIYCNTIAPGIPYAQPASFNNVTCGFVCSPSPSPTPTPSASPAPSQNVLIRDCCTNQNTFQIVVDSNLVVGNTIVIAGVCYQIYAVGGNGSNGNYTGVPYYINCIECVADYPCPVDPNKPTTLKPSVQPTTFTPTGGTAPCVVYTAVSEMFQFNVVPACNPFGNEQIMFKNRYGVYDYFLFERARAEGIGINRETYGQWNVAWGSDNPIKTNYSRGTTDFNTDINETHIVNTGFITQVMMVWLEELFTTNDAYLIQTDGTLFPINIVSTEFVRKTKGNKSIFNIEMTYSYSNNIKLLNN